MGCCPCGLTSFLGVSSQQLSPFTMSQEEIARRLEKVRVSESNLNEAQKEECRRKFAAYDKDNSGAFTVSLGSTFSDRHFFRDTGQARVSCPAGRHSSPQD